MALPRFRGFALAVLAWALPGAPGHATPSSSLQATSTARARQDSVPALRMYGEFGLWVRDVSGGMAASWITRAPAPGLLQVVVHGRVTETDTTASGLAHTAKFKRPHADSFTLRYGALNNPRDRYQTTLYPKDDGRRRPARIDKLDSLYVMGDSHGEYDDLVQTLHNAGLVDPKGHWSGGDAHLVMLGDMLDRGQDATRILWFLYRLEREAEHSGGRVHVVLGNHEIMVMTNDLRYTQPKERRIAQLYGTDYWRMFDPRSSELGRWLASMPAVLQVGDIIMAHGGIAPHIVKIGYSVQSLDDSLARFIHEPLFARWADSTVSVPPMDSVAYARRYDMFWGDQSVFWYRGYVMQDTLGQALQSVLDHYHATLQVVGHTPLRTIQVRYGGRFIDTDLLQPATEMLLLVRAGKGYSAYRIPLVGPFQPLARGPIP